MSEPESTLPFMPFWVDRFFGGTLKMDGEEQSLYMLLLAHQWATGPLPKDLRRIAKLIRYDEKRFLKLWPAVRPKYVETEAGYINESLEEIRDTANSRQTKARENGAAGGARKWGSAPSNNLKRSERLAAARRLGTHSASEWYALVHVCGSCCVRCGAIGLPLVKDHIKPIYQGGSDAITNIQPLCKSCNSSKGPDATDHRPNDWQERLAKRLASDALQTPASVTDISELRTQNLKKAYQGGEP